MRVLWKAMLAVGLLALVVNLAPAQQRQRQGRGRGGMGGVAQLLNTKEVQQELNLSDDQVEKAKKVAEDVQTKHQEDFQKLQDVPREERRAKTQELAGQVREETLKDLGDVLKPEQTKRLKQLILQQQLNGPFGGGPGVLLSPDVEKALALTDKQKEDLKTLADDYRKQVREAMPAGGGGGGRGRGGFNEETRKKMEDLRKEALDNAVKVLDDKQKTQLKEMTGEPFKFPTPQRRGRGGDGR